VASVKRFDIKDFPGWKTYLDLIPFEDFKKDVRQDYEYNKTYMEYHRSPLHDTMLKKLPLDLSDLSTLYQKISQERIFKSKCEFNIVMTLVFSNKLFSTESLLKSKGATLFGIPLSLEECKSFGDCAFPSLLSRGLMYNGSKFRELDKAVLYILRQLIPNRYVGDGGDGKGNGKGEGNISFDVTSKGSIPYTVAGAASAWHAFTESVMRYGSGQILVGTDINMTSDVHVVRVVDCPDEDDDDDEDEESQSNNKSKNQNQNQNQKKKKSRKINPEYADWERRRDFLKDIVTTSANATLKDSDALVKFACVPSPPKYVKDREMTDAERDEKRRREVKVEHVGPLTLKEMSTLYLRSEDKTRLLNSLTLFATKKEAIRDLGLPHKLGVLLHGEPGTGKSTTIAAIASYLRKDVYYLHLGSVKTNDDLRMLFEHVTKNCARGGGVIVMEDIDAMAPVVLKRTFASSVNTASDDSASDDTASENTASGNTVQELMDSGSSKVTLDYFLNLLQGTLTLDGMVFVTTTNHLDKLDPAFYRPGRFDVVLELKKCDRYQIASAFKRFLGREPSASVMARVEEDRHTPAAVTSRLASFVCSSTKPEDDASILEVFTVDRTVV
jgi:DNA replication protein DnaC